MLFFSKRCFHVLVEKRRLCRKVARGRGDKGHGDARTRGRGDVARHFYHLFNISYYFTKSSSLTELYPGVKFSFVQCETDCEQSSFLSQRPGGK